jgi:uncharacterized protein
MLRRRAWGWGVVGLGVLLCAAVAGRTALFNERYFHYARPAAQLPADLPGLRAVAFTTSDGLQLRGWYLPSRNRAVVVLAHGLGQTRVDLLPEARALAQAGFGVLLFDLRAHGESGGRTSTWGDRERLDVAAALAFVRAQPEVDPLRVGALGFSIGSAAVAEVVAADPTVAAAVLLSPFNTLHLAATYDVRKWGPVGRFGALVPFWLRGIALDEVQTFEAVERIRPRPLLIVMGTEESGQPLAQALFARVRPYAQIWHMQGAGHGGFSQVQPHAYPARLRAFFEVALLAPAPAAAHRE